VVILVVADDWTSKWWAREIAEDYADAGKSYEIRMPKSKKDVQRAFESEAREIVILAHGTETSRFLLWRKKGPPRKTIFGSDWDSLPGFGPKGFPWLVEPRQVAGWKKGPNLRDVYLHACYQGAGRRAKQWRDAFGPAVNMHLHPGSVKPFLRAIFE